MNKVIAVLGIIVLLTLAMLFFCIGFFTGSSISPSSITTAISTELKGEKANSDMSEENIAKKLGEIGDVKSAKLSDKIMNILATAGYTVENFSEIIKHKTSSTLNNFKKNNASVERINVDSLLREMVASHTPQDSCSYQKTVNDIQIKKQTPVTDRTLYGKKIVFIGYFKNAIALQIQKLLTGKGYKTHVEISKSGDGSDSFVFCGPFKKDSTANNLLQWLRLHDFSEARIVSITKEAIEETLYDAANDLTDLPANDENVAPMQHVGNTFNNTNTAPNMFSNTASNAMVSVSAPSTEGPAAAQSNFSSSNNFSAPSGAPFATPTAVPNAFSSTPATTATPTVPVVSSPQTVIPAVSQVGF